MRNRIPGAAVSITNSAPSRSTSGFSSFMQSTPNRPQRRLYFRQRRGHRVEISSWSTSWMPREAKAASAAALSATRKIM